MKIDNKVSKNMTFILTIILFLITTILLIITKIITSIPHTTLISSKAYDILITAIIILLIAAIVITFLIIKSIVLPIKKNKLISTNTYDIFELKTNERFISFSYIDENDKLIKDFDSQYTISQKIYISEKNQVTIECFGKNGIISEKKLIKLYVTETTYKYLSKLYKW